MSTMAQLIDRVYGEYLEPLDDFPSYTLLETAIDNSPSTTTVVYKSGFLTPEEQDLLDAGAVIEIGSELMLVEDIDTSVRQLTVVRAGVKGTGPIAAHSANDYIYINPEIRRINVFNAMADAVVNLHPPLYRVKSEEIWATPFSWDLPADAWVALEVRYHDGERWVPGGSAEILHDHPDSDTGKAVQLYPPFGARNILRYKAAFSRPSAETDDLLGDTIGLEADMEQPVIVATLSHILSGRDVPSITQEFVTEAAELQGFPPGSGEQLRNSLIRYYNHLINQIRRRLRQRDTTQTEYLEPYPGFYR